MSTLAKSIGALMALIVFVVWFTNHSGFIPFEHNPMQYMPNMHRTPALIPMRAYSFYEDGASVRPQPQGSLARTQHFYPYTKEVAAATVPGFSNPLPKSREVVKRGQYMYQNNCIVCHGSTGMGDGSIIGAYPKPPLLVSDKINAYADSQIFHVITVGQNIMGAYGPKIREEDRWAIVHYVRVLQRAYTPSSEDLSRFKNEIGNPKENP